MGKYQKYRYQQVKERRWKVHPIWRGIGLLFIIMIPIMSLAGAILLVRQNLQHGWIQVPAGLMKSVSIPQLAEIAPELSRLYLLDGFVMLAFLVLGFGILSVFYSLLYSIFAPSRYGPVDAPPIRKSPRNTPR